jgi:hypothetical protein
MIKEKSNIIGLHQAGTKGMQIAIQLEHPITTVYTIIKNFCLRKTNESPKSPRALKKSIRNVWVLTHNFVQECRMPLSEITASATLNV